MAEEGLDFLTLVDRNGLVVIRFHNPSVSGDSVFYDPFIQMALGKKEISGTQVLSGGELSKEGRLGQKAIIQSIPVPKENDQED